MYNTEKPRDVMFGEFLMQIYCMNILLKSLFYTGFFFKRDLETNTIKLQQWTNTDL